MIKRIFLLLVLALVVIAAVNYQMLLYGLGQLKGQVDVLWNSEAIEHYLEDESFPDSLKQKILLVQEAKAFAVDSLGLEPSGSYDKLYDQQGKAILWVLTAAPEFSLEPYKWDYPFLGELEYKGYFDSLKAEDEAKRLRSEGFDVSIGEVSAWSTLGFFDDPILSKTLERSNGKLAELIIHELTHGTIYLADDAELNENLATLIGVKGAYRFLEGKYGLSSEEYREYDEHMKDVDLFVDAALEMCDLMDALYTGMSDSSSIDERRQQKKLFFRFALDRFKRLPLSKPDRFGILERDTVEANNTFFTGLSTYRAQQDSLEGVLNEEYNRDLRLFIEGVKELYN